MAKRGTKINWWIFILAVSIVLFIMLAYGLPNGKTTKEEAIAIVKTLPEVKDYLKRVPQGMIAVSGEEDNMYLIQVYEFKDNHTATFNWYKVNKQTGEIKKEF